MKKNRVVEIKAIGVRCNNDWNYIPIQVQAIKYENGVQLQIYESLISPIKSVSNAPDMPKYLSSQILECAPNLYSVAQQIKDFVKDSEIHMDALSEQYFNIFS